MRKLLLIITAFILSAHIYSAKAQCTPDSAIYSAGSYLYPAVLPFATATKPYTQVLTFKVPKDTTVLFSGLNVQVHVDSAKLIYITGIPAGYTYQCNNPSCTWNGGTLGCALLSGNSDTSKVGSFPMMVYVYTWAEIGASAPYTPYTRTDSSSYTFKILSPTGIFSIEPVVQLNAYPNPVTNILTIELTNIHSQKNTVEVFDPTGKRVFIKEFERVSAYQLSEKIDLSTYANGLYTVVLRADDKVSIKKILRN